MHDPGLIRKDMLIKKAIREIAEHENIPYCEVELRDIFFYMKENRMGVRWISKMCIQVVRSRLPESYRFKKED